METYIALIRGINVGGHNKVKMADLAAMLQALGFTNPKTLLQSGNAVFQAKKLSRQAAEETLREGAETHLKARLDFFVRTAAEWKEIIDANPFETEAKDDPSHLLVTVLKSSPDRDQVEAVNSAITGPEKIAAGSEHLYIVFPEGIGTSTIDRTPGYKKLAATGTARNWNTVLKLAALTDNL